MKKSFTSILGALALLAGLFSAGQASAAAITGSLGYTSLFGFTANNPNLTLATQIGFPGLAQVSGNVSGTFAAAGILAGDAITLDANPLFVNSALALPVTPIWSIAGFSLTLTSIEELPGNVPTSLGLTGTGWVSGPEGTSPSPGTWVATFNREGVNYTFSSSTTANNVPEGGTALALLGLGLLGLEGARRKLTAAKA